MPCYAIAPKKNSACTFSHNKKVLNAPQPIIVPDWITLITIIFPYLRIGASKALSYDVAAFLGDNPTLDLLYLSNLDIFLAHLTPSQAEQLQKNCLTVNNQRALAFMDAPKKLTSLSRLDDDCQQRPSIKSTPMPTWGLAKTGVLDSKATGDGVKVAALDTGNIPFDHPDYCNGFKDRIKGYKSFIPDQDVVDYKGHGTHCLGTACGPATSTSKDFSRYGVAPKSSIYVAKVLNNFGMGTDCMALAGLDWAVGQGCDIVCLALSEIPGQRTCENSEAFEHAAAHVSKKTLIVAAAGNNGPGSGVSYPACCPSVLAVSAVNPKDQMYRKSSTGEQVGIAGPGQQIYSSWTRPLHYFTTTDGTSMATAHVAGIAALWIEACKGKGHPSAGNELKQILKCSAKDIKLSKKEVGAGLVQAPVDSNIQKCCPR